MCMFVAYSKYTKLNPIVAPAFFNWKTNPFFVKLTIINYWKCY